MMRSATAVAALVLLHPALATAQQAIHTDAANTPSPGVLLLRQQFQFAHLGDDPSSFDHEVDDYLSTTRLSYGLTRELALTLDIAILYRRIEWTAPAGSAGGGGGGGHDHGSPTPGPPAQTFDEEQFGLDDITLGLKLRVFTHDSGPLDTARLAFIAAAELPTGNDDFSSDSLDPIIGGVFTLIRGRHGFDASVRWKFNTGHSHPLARAAMGSADALLCEAAYLYRISPRAFDHPGDGALYALIETTGVYETNGDTETLIAPGLMYEQRNFAVELSLQLPLLHDVDHRLRTEYSVMAGLRWMF